MLIHPLCLNPRPVVEIRDLSPARAGRLLAFPQNSQLSQERKKKQKRKNATTPPGIQIAPIGALNTYKGDSVLARNREGDVSVGYALEHENGIPLHWRGVGVGCSERKDPPLKAEAFFPLPRGDFHGDRPSPLRPHAFASDARSFVPKVHWPKS